MHPIFFQIGSIKIYSYGALVALAVFISYFLVRMSAKRQGISQNIATDLLFFLFLTGILGARASYVLQHFDEYQGHLWKVFSLQEGGLVWYGGFIGAALASLVYAHLQRWPLAGLFDLFSPALAMAHGLGRIGCFLNGCCYGKETEGMLAVHFPGDDVLRHPTQLYEAVLLFLLSGFLFRLSLKRRWEGQVFVVYLLGYSVIRFGVEFFRGDQDPIFFLTLPQWTSTILFTGAVILWNRLGRRKASG